MRFFALVVLMLIAITAVVARDQTLQPAPAAKTNNAAPSTIATDAKALQDLATRLQGPSSTPGDVAKQVESLRQKMATMAKISAKNTQRIAKVRKVVPKGPAPNYSKSKVTGNTYYSVRQKNGQFVKKPLVALNGACATSENEWGFCISANDCKGRSRRSVTGPCLNNAVCCLRDTPPATVVNPADQYAPQENQKCMGANGRAYDGICMTQTDCRFAEIRGGFSVETPGVSFCNWSKNAKPSDKSSKLVCCQPKREYSAPSPNIIGTKRNRW